jgi:hypothetical protein
MSHRGPPTIYSNNGNGGNGNMPLNMPVADTVKEAAKVENKFEALNMIDDEDGDNNHNEEYDDEEYDHQQQQSSEQRGEETTAAAN